MNFCDADSHVGTTNALIVTNLVDSWPNSCGELSLCQCLQCFELGFESDAMCSLVMPAFLYVHTPGE